MVPLFVWHAWSLLLGGVHVSWCDAREACSAAKLPGTLAVRAKGGIMA
ncbi:hypothetical protein Pcar_3481 [Syntrophotalea carbinolica DSM 2380]|uniref:Uncharacterized protein n=1 Tax=Syntrophotalea carbinolica (strain DSM 2380 / NBRC 103641 / GraBd1) TaxID=338963 RepID=J9TJJ8_SYNC1|nr:hypothetical protein Pcar_3481 [Syntrophotalea carbinolica DSM 2380]